jgi:hypothetical protein
MALCHGSTPQVHSRASETTPGPFSLFRAKLITHPEKADRIWQSKFGGLFLFIQHNCTHWVQDMLRACHLKLPVTSGLFGCRECD